MLQGQTQTMSGTAASRAESPRKELDEAVAVLRGHARELARLSPREKAALIRECIPRLVDVGPVWVATGCKAKGLPLEKGGEEWLAGVGPTVRHLRLLAENLDAIAQGGKPPFGRSAHVRRDGRVAVEVFPSSTIDKVSFAGFSAHAILEPGLDLAAGRAKQASFYGRRDPDGGVSLILGAGNVSSIPPMDAFTKMFNEGNVCLVKMNPVNEWVGPLLERALAPMVRRGFLRFVYGGGDAGKYLCEHEGIADVHITGSDKTHDLIVWGPPGPERERRIAAKDPVLKKPITSELGNVSPVVIVPYAYSDEELWFQARNVVTMVVNNASFNCNAAKMLVVSKQWPQRAKFLELVARGLGSLPTRKAYYPGARDRWEMLTAGQNVQRFGTPGDGELPWALIRDVPSGGDDKLFTTEPFCALLSETSLDESDPAAFLAAATTFLNDRMWGTLNAAIVIHPRLEEGAVGAALDRAVNELRYGTVAINHWPAVSYAVVTPPWGGHPSATPENIQSGLGWVHNTYMLEGIEKCVLRGPLVVKPKPVWFYDHKNQTRLGPRLVSMEAKPSWFKLPGIIARAL
jgi:acyl-CoA reductase-like NAD-dependent aldehyde dehydrogenase